MEFMYVIDNINENSNDAFLRKMTKFHFITVLIKDLLSIKSLKHSVL